MKNNQVKNLSLLFALLFSIWGYSQTVSGTVSDANGPLIGANVVIKGTSNGATADFDGNYTLNDVTSGATIVYSFIGYTTKEITYAGQAEVNVTLEEDASQLEEVVIIGYGVKKKSVVTGAISSIKSEDLESSSNQRVEQTIQGRTSGVTVTSSSGSPGAGAKIRIRGAGSNGNADPLYIVDGLKVGGIENIAPSDIQSIEILKDGASTAIYGTDGANGIVLITTKKGKKGKTTITYNTQAGIQSPRTKTELMNAQQFVQYMQEAGQTDIVDNGIDTNWLDATFQEAFFQRHDLSFSGGAEKMNYYISGSLLDQDGVVGGDNSSFKRYSLRMNLKSDVKSWLEVGTNLSYTNSKNNGVPENSDTRGVIQNALILDPLTPVTYSGATPQSVIDLADANGVPLLTNNAGAIYGYPTYSNGEVLNPVAYANTIADVKGEDAKLILSAYAKLKLTKKLTFTSRFGLESGNFFTKNFTIPYYLTSESQNRQYLLTENRVRSSKWLWENFASYTKDFGEHRFTLLGGYSAEELVVPFNFVSASVSVEDYTDPYMTFFTDFNPPTGSVFRDNLTSYFGRLSYSYLGKYLFEASGRYDRSDKFPEANRSAPFPALSAGWVVSKENFWSQDAKINFFKLRGSWGQNGSRRNLEGNADRTFLINSVANGGLVTYEDILGIGLSDIPNTKLLWESSEQLDIGLDLRAFSNKLTFTTDYYVKTTKDLAINDGSLVSPGSAGGEIKEFNGGIVENKGLEFELGWNETNSRGFNYGVNLNLSTLKNEVLKIEGVGSDSFLTGAGAPQNDDGVTRFQEGFPIWYFYGYETNGIDSATGEIIIVDTDGVDGITASDKTLIGSPHPDILYGGNLFMGYKNFDFNLQFQGTSGNDILSTYHQPSRSITNKPVHWYDNRWTANNTKGATFPAAEFATSAYQTDLVVEDGSYMRIKQIQLGYSLPNTFIKNINMNKVRLYVSLDDFFTFTKYKGLDPEVGSFEDNALGIDKGFYPVSGRMIVGLSVDF